MITTKLTKKELSKLSVEVTPEGFTVWMGKGKARRWLLDGSLVLKSGRVSLGDIKSKYFAVYNTSERKIEIRKFKKGKDPFK